MLVRTLAVLALAVHAQTAVAQVSTGPEPLRGLRSLAVRVREYRADTAIGSDTASLRVPLELELRRAGILVSDSASVVLRLTIGFRVHPSIGLNAVSYDLQLKEWVRLQRQPEAGPFWATTWSCEGLGLGGSAVLTRLIQDVSRDLAQVFLNDYLAANPPQR